MKFFNIAICQDKAVVVKPEAYVQRIAGLNARFIVALISDGVGGTWIGTEDDGIFYCNADNKISQYTTRNGLGDNNGYALAIDKLGRLWAGHLKSGVSVFNGKDWKNYDVIDGPIGERIFDIKICPKDGDVWMATSAGITRYKINSDTWEYITRKDGLLENQISALAFKHDGTLIAGTQCHGLAIFNRNANGDYKHTKNILAANRFGPNNYSPIPLTPTGNSLPSNLINDIIVTKNSETQSIWIAANTGLVKSNDTLTKFEYWRGKDYVNKIHGLYGGAPKDFKQAPKEVFDQLLPEDHLTCLAEDELGIIWIGTRQNGFITADPKTGKRFVRTPQQLSLPDIFVTKILPLYNGGYLLGFNGGGIVKSIKPINLIDRKPAETNFNKDKIFSVAQNDFPIFPSKIKPLTIEDLKLMQTQIRNLKKTLPKNYATYYGEDWKTQGNWVGHYGRDYAVMCGTSSPFDQMFFTDETEIMVRPFIGINKRKGDSLRRWIHWVESGDRRVMYSSLNGKRRQAEWDDHAETYPISHNGPDLWYLLDIKKSGVYKLSMYFFNKDGHQGNNRFRDFLVEIYPANVNWTKNSDTDQFNKIAESQTKNQPLARTRVNNFWGGTHKSFEITGEGKYFVRVANNFCYCTIMSSVCVDKLQGESIINDKFELSLQLNVPYQPPQFPETVIYPAAYQAQQLWNTLDICYDKFDTIEINREYRIRMIQTVI
ncbi:MAG: hypothetical protein LBE18_00435, partial [Planctomycetaceae bacterium]|nr:hypothetical protein [Planctomycetaceae bacterium]